MNVIGNVTDNDTENGTDNVPKSNQMIHYFKGEVIIMKKKLISALLCVAMVSSMLVGCGSKTEEAPAAETKAEATEDKAEGKTEAADTEASAEGGKVYYLNFKPEVDQQWQEIAEAYTAETGVEVKVVTAASGTYEEVLKSEFAGADAPTLFQINGPVGYNSWKDYCLNLKDTELYNALSDKGLQ